MSVPSFALSAVENQTASNPLGLVRIDHFQMTGSLERLENLYRRVGFARVASGKGHWGRVAHLHQNRMDILIFDAQSNLVAQAGASRFHTSEIQKVAALHAAIIDGANRAEANRACALYMQENFGIWGGKVAAPDA